MKEVNFLKQNSNAWKQFEADLNARSVDPDRLAEEFIKLTDDLSYSKTYYPQSNTTQYLNGLASTVHQKIYRNKREKGSRFFTFWKYEVPQAAYELRKPILYSFIMLLITVGIGTISVMNNDHFARIIMGNDYMDMTMENIKKGDPMGVYKSGPALESFLMIAFNNIKVMFAMFAMGILTPFGTGFMIFQNGVMLGAFQFFFIKFGLVGKTALSIWIHGTLEISSMVLSGGAGLALGNALLFPGTYTRMESIKMAAQRGIVLIIGLVPVIITAAFFEGFVTRHSEMPIWLSLIIICGSLAFIVYYFIIYPFLLNNKSKNEERIGV
jgi:uncharacterized membrane protein SpoIIM required for sporulation